MKKKGFTLIELLVVIAVIGMLASIVLVSLGPARKKARDARRQSDIREINLAMELCYDDANCGAGSEQYISTTGGINNVTQIGQYMPDVPEDPTGSGSYQYTWIANNTLDPVDRYCVYVKLEAPTTDTWIAASEKGTRMNLTAEPAVLDDCF